MTDNEIIKDYEEEIQKPQNLKTKENKTNE